LSELVAKDGCAAVVVVNKWDRVAPKAAEDMDAYKADVKAQLRAVGWAPIVCTTARCEKIQQHMGQAANIRDCK
jgi:GTP-binding protein